MLPFRVFLCDLLQRDITLDIKARTRIGVEKILKKEKAYEERESDERWIGI